MWRKGVMRKGNYKCAKCGALEDLTADHILPVVSHPELTFDIDNGRILCNKCRVKDMLKNCSLGIFRPKKLAIKKLEGE